MAQVSRSNVVGENRVGLVSHSHFGTSESKSGRKVGPSAAVQTVNICRQMIFIEYQHTNTPDGRPEMLQLSFDF